MAIGGYVRTLWVPTRHRPDFKKALSTLHRLKKAEDKAYYQNGRKALPHRGGNGKLPGGIPHLRHHRDDGPSTDRSGKPAKTVIGPIIRGMILKINLMRYYSSKFGNSQQQFTVTDGVKSIPPTTENWLRKLYEYSMNNNTSTEDKHETNHINSKCNDTNTDTRKLHNM